MTLALSLLGVLFVALKLTEVIAWSWWLVCAPFGVLMIPWLLVGILWVCVGAEKLNNRLRRNKFKRLDDLYKGWRR